MKTYLINGAGLVPTSNWVSNCWIKIVNPSEEDKQYITKDLEIPEEFYNDIEDVNERPRIEMDDGWTFIVLRIPYKNLDNKIPFSTVPLGIIFKEDIFVTICFYETEMLEDFITYTNRKLIIKKDHFDLVLKLHLSSSVWFLKYLKAINELIKLAENKLEKSIQNKDLQTLLQIEKCLVFYTTSLKGNDILAHRIKNLQRFRHTFDEELVEDVDIELRQALETTNIYSDILSGMMDAYASVISNNLNIVMKQLTIFSVILMIPTLIASLYGMNVPNGFEDNKWGFWIILSISLMFASIVAIVFTKRKWF